MTYRLCIFDVDGTLLDSRNSITGAFEGMLRDLGMEGTVSRERFRIGYPLLEIFEELGITDIERARKYYARYYYKHIHTEKPFPGIVALLNGLHTRIHMAVCTNKSIQGATTTLTNNGLLNYFDVLQTADKGAHKPDGAPFQEILDFYRSAGTILHRPDCLMVGDSPIDMEFAYNAGIDCAFVRWGFYSEDQLAHRPTHCFSSPAELAEMISGPG